MTRRLLVILVALLAFGVITPALAQDSDFVFGMVLVGPKNDKGWSQAHYEAGQYVEQHIPGAKMIVFESLNPADAPQTTVNDVVGQMADQGAKLVILSSDSFSQDSVPAAKAFPNVTIINSSGDDALKGDAPPNLGNVMMQVEWSKMIAGCAAGLTTKTGSIGYLGPLIDSETRRFAASAYLGAKYCYEHYAGGDPSKLTFTVTWIGFWFNIPGVTLDPTEVANNFYASGADVVLSGIDTSEALKVADKLSSEGKPVWAIGYDYKNACDEAPKVCLGVPYYNWGPEYTKQAQAVKDGTWKQNWTWDGPDWSDINNADTTGTGFVKGPALSADNAAHVDEFIKYMSEYATNPFTPFDQYGYKSFALWSGPLNYQDGTELVAPGQNVDPIDVWYLKQLLQGMTGPSESK